MSACDSDISRVFSRTIIKKEKRKKKFDRVKKIAYFYICDWAKGLGQYFEFGNSSSCILS